MPTFSTVTYGVTSRAHSAAVSMFGVSRATAMGAFVGVRLLEVTCVAPGAGPGCREEVAEAAPRRDRLVRRGMRRRRAGRDPRRARARRGCGGRCRPRP